MMNAINDLLMRLSHEREHPADVFRLVERELPGSQVARHLEVTAQDPEHARNDHGTLTE